MRASGRLLPIVNQPGMSDKKILNLLDHRLPPLVASCTFIAAIFG
jgi:hypothetical protein